MSKSQNQNVFSTIKFISVGPFGPLYRLNSHWGEGASVHRLPLEPEAWKRVWPYLIGHYREYPRRNRGRHNSIPGKLRQYTGNLRSRFFPLVFQTKVVCYTAVREERPSDRRLVHRQIRYNMLRSNNIFLQRHCVESSLWLRTRLDATISRAPGNVQASIKDGTVFSHQCVFAQTEKNY